MAEMASVGVFSEASPLKCFHGPNLLEYHDFERSDDRKLFSSITNQNFKIQKVVKINNPLLYGLYLLRKEELSCDDSTEQECKSARVQERMLYHATSSDRAESIARNNIDWRLTSRSRFGKGACFATSPKYAHEYSSQDGAFVVCKVLVKKLMAVSINYELDIPSNVECDTALGNCDSVTVKFDDYTFYPQYIVYYTSDGSHHVKKIRRRSYASFVWRCEDSDHYLEDDFDSDLFWRLGKV